MSRFLLPLVLLFLSPVPKGWAQNPPELGGVIIDELPFPKKILGLFDCPWCEHLIVASPSITVLDDGTYIASYEVFERGTGVGICKNGAKETKVFRSTTGGSSWAQVGTFDGLAAGTVFKNGSFLYILGIDKQCKFIIYRSTDKGDSWGAAHEIGDSPGLISPNAPVTHDNRIWFSFAGAGAMSAPISANLLDPDSWEFTNRIKGDTNWLNGTFTFWSEAQIVASPKTGVVVLPKTDDLPYTALIQITDSSTAIFAPSTGIIHFPGGGKKFACVYDPVSEKFFALTNPVLPEHKGQIKKIGRGMIRNTGAILSSKDLTNWQIEKIFLYTPIVGKEAFQYFNFVIHGNDLLIVSRTALRRDGRYPPRGHDANIFSFHVVKDFRRLKRAQVLVSDTDHNRVLRYEANLTTRLAPLGKFTDHAMTKPIGIAQDRNGDVYVSEHAGRVTRFSSDGTFKEIIAVTKTDFLGLPESLTIGPDGNLYMSVAFGSHSDKIYKINTKTKKVSLFIHTVFTSPAGAGTLNDPRGLAFGPDGNLYVADRNNDKIRKFNGSTGEFMGNLTTDQRRPQALAWDPSGNRLLFSRRTTNSDNDIARVKLDGAVLTLYTKKDIGMALGVQSLEGRVYWTDYNKSKIYASVSEPDKTKAVSVSKLSWFSSSPLQHPGNMAYVFPAPKVEYLRPLLKKALAADLDRNGTPDPLVLGFGQAALIIDSTNIDCVVGWLPYNGTKPTALVRNNGIVGTDCKPGLNPTDTDGKITNPLLGEALKLAIILRLDPDFGNTLLRDLNCKFHPLVLRTLDKTPTITELMEVTNFALGNRVLAPHLNLLLEALACINEHLSAGLEPSRTVYSNK